MTKVEIRDLHIMAIIGTLPEERKTKQEIVLNVAFEYDAGKAAEADDFQYAVDYQKMEQDLLAFVEGSSFQLLEALGRKILDKIMEDERIQAGSVTIDKPQALDKARSVAVTMTRKRS